MKVDRLLAIITLLLKHDKMRAKELAEKLEVSVRTILRDIDEICKAGIPVITYQGGNGGIGIAEGYKLDKNVLTVRELEHILMGLKSIESVSLNTDVERLVEKLTPREENKLSAHHLFIDLTSLHQTSLPPKINLLREAAGTNSEVRFDYYAKTGTSEREIEPYFILFRWSSWYVFGFCKAKQDFRLFKLTRMARLKVLDSLFIPRSIPKEKLAFDHYFEQHTETITLLMDRSLEYKLIDDIGEGHYEITGNDQIRVSFPYTDHDFVMQLIRSYGDKVKVLSPQSVIDELKTYAANILQMYK